MTFGAVTSVRQGIARRCRIDFASRGRRPGIPEISRASKLLIIGAASGSRYFLGGMGFHGNFTSTPRAANSTRWPGL